MSQKAKLNYAIDVAIGVMFLFSALAGLILFFAPSGYQGGRNPYYNQPVLGLNTHAWDTIHTWSSMAMIAGIGAHIALHWTWIVCMTRKALAVKRRPKQDPAACPIE
jgi:hypothetical protein